MSNAIPSIDRSYSIAFTPRSGSNAICHLLAQSGVGAPGELFQEPLGNHEHFPRRDGQDFLDRFFRLIERHQACGIFGAKMSHDHRAAVDELLVEAIPGYRTLDDVLPNHRWVWLTRRDKILQAISLCRAETSNSWVHTQQISVKSQNFKYDYLEILSRFLLLSAADLAWDIYFSKYDIVHYKIIYEDFFTDSEHGLNQLADYLGGVPKGFREGRVLPIAPLQIQRDAESLEMRERFIADLERVGGREFEAEQGEQLKRWNRFFFERGWRD